MQAITVYNEYFKTNTPGIDEARNIAQCYVITGNSIEAEKWLSKVLTFVGYLPKDVLSYANMLKSNSKFDEAIKQYQNYLKIQPSAKDKVTELVKSCKKAKEWIAIPEDYDVTNVKELNSASSDFGLFPIGNGFIYTSDRLLKRSSSSGNKIYGWTGKPYLKLNFVKKDKKGDFSSSPLSIESLDNGYHNGPGCFDANTNTIYFSRTKMVKITKKPINNDPTSWYEYSFNNDYLNRIEIYSAKYNNGVIDRVEPFKYNNVEMYSVGHPAISADGKTFYFVSDMDSGYGGTDIYYCTLKNNGEWSLPKNAGPVINSQGKELFPTIDKNNTLYFSSTENSVMGGLDLFYAKGSKDSWSVPQNLKYPINSTKDDFLIFYTDDSTGYFSSNRLGGVGDDDIYHFVKKNSTKKLKDTVIISKDTSAITLTDTSTVAQIITPVDTPIKTPTITPKVTPVKTPEKTQIITPPIKKPTITPIKPVIVSYIVKEKLKDNTYSLLEGVEIEIKNLTNNTTKKVTTDKKGRFYYTADSISSLIITATRDGYYTQKKALSSKSKTKNDTISDEMIFEKIVLNKPVVIENIYYDYGKWDIKPASAVELNKIVKMMNDNPNIKIEMSSHTDSRSSSEFNDTLSQKRANAAAEYIISKGIESSRVKAFGYGETKLRNRCKDGVICTEAEHALNRRTEFMVIN
ncbi:MAG: OmpA family protein [Bacteroidetes bacterium]|nr:OmpA family protein [Bacteroidota bacterium]